MFSNLIFNRLIIHYLFREKIFNLKKEINLLVSQRELHRSSRTKLDIPKVALVGYTNAGKSSLLNKMSQAG